MTQIISIEGSSFDEKLRVFFAFKSMCEKDVYFLDDNWELPDHSSDLECIMKLTHFTQYLYSTISRERTRYIVTFFSPFTAHQHCKHRLTLYGDDEHPNKTLYKNLVEILEDDLLQRHTVVIYLSLPHAPTHIVEERYLSGECRTLLRYRPLCHASEEMHSIVNAMMNYIGFVNLPLEHREDLSTEGKSYRPGVNYGKVKFFNKYGTVSCKTFYVGSLSFPLTLNCFTTVFH